MKRLLPALLAAAALPAAAQVPVTPTLQLPADSAIVTLQVSERIERAPDIAQVRAGVTSLAATAGAALAETARRMNLVIARARASGIADRDIQTSGIGVVAALLWLLGFGNILIAIFNLFPGYPLDGGRVLRAFLWKQGYDLNEATRFTGRCGQLIALALVAFGIFVALWRGDLFTGLWTVLVGLFLLDSAIGIVGHTLKIEKVTVAEVMTPPVSIKPETTVSQFVDHTLQLHRYTAFPVALDKRLYGILMLEDLKKLPRSNWHKTFIRDVMRPITEDLFVSPAVRLNDARELMKENGAGALAVVDERGFLIGFLQPGKIRKKV
jgi:CBS domain-containing protein